MLDFITMFNDNYQYYLDEVKYKVLTIGQPSGKPELYVKDSITFDYSDSTLKINATRTVGFTPESVYTLSVSYGAEIKLRGGVQVDSSIDWKKEFLPTPVCSNILQNLFARISLQISQITSSYGHNPLVTPPNYME